MATNFFEQQENARRKTVWLVVYFLLSIVAIIGLLFVLIEVVLANTGNPLNAWGVCRRGFWGWWAQAVF